MTDYAATIDLTSDRVHIFDTALLPEASPYSLQSNPKIKIAHYGTEFVPVTDVIKEADEKGILRPRKIRYMKSEESIYVDEQEKNGVSKMYGKMHTGADRRNREDVILIERGKIEVNPKENANLIAYLLKCNYNGSNPHRDKARQVLFFYHDTKSKAKADFIKSKQVDKAKGLVLTLEGNYRRLQDVALLLHLDGNADEFELLVKMRNMAETNPELIITTISEDKAQIDLIVTQALNSGIIEFTGTAYRYTGQEENIKGFRGKQNPDVAAKVFIEWLGKDEGQADLMNIQKLLEAKQRQLLQNTSN